MTGKNHPTLAEITRQFISEYVNILSLETSTRLVVRTYNPFTGKPSSKYKIRVLEKGSPIVEIQEKELLPSPTRMEYVIAQHFDSHDLVGKIIAPMCRMLLTYPGTKEDLTTDPVKSVSISIPNSNVTEFRNWNIQVE